MSNKASICRICGDRDLAPVLSLGNLPAPNALLTSEQLGKPEPKFLLDLVLCTNCSLLQITETVPPEFLFRNYPYFSSFSDTMLRHAREMADNLIGTLNLTPKNLVVEVGSNDGYLLQYFKQMGIPVLGIEPATNIASVAESSGIPTINEFFDDHLAKKLFREGKQADVIIGNNVLAHVASLHEFVDGVHSLLKPQGTAVFEVAYARETIDHCEFDQIYHEHLCYYSLTALAHLFNLHGLEVIDAEVVAIHGGSLMIRVQRKGYALPSARVSALSQEEKKWGIKEPGAYAGFAAKVAAKRQALLSLLRELKTAGHRIAGYGAAAKGAVMLNAFRIGSDLLDYVVDRSPHKQGKFMTGCHLPIYEPGRLLVDMPSYTLMLAWNFADEILDQQAEYRRRGGRFIVPIPELKII